MRTQRSDEAALLRVASVGPPTMLAGKEEGTNTLTQKQGLINCRTTKKDGTAEEEEEFAAAAATRSTT